VRGGLKRREYRVRARYQIRANALLQELPEGIRRDTEGGEFRDAVNPPLRQTELKMCRTSRIDPRYRGGVRDAVCTLQYATASNGIIDVPHK